MKIIYNIYNVILKLGQFYINLLIFRLNKVNIIRGDVRNINGIPFLRNKGEFIIGENVKINTNYSSNPIGGQEFCTFYIKDGASLKIDRNAGISNSTIICWESINIGKHVFIGGDCKIYDTDFHSIYLKNRISERDDDIKTAPIMLSDGCFIGTGTIILKGVTVGKNSVIGAGSVVTKDIPDNEVWAGNPAKFIKRLNK